MSVQKTTSDASCKSLMAMSKCEKQLPLKKGKEKGEAKKDIAEQDGSQRVQWRVE
jgi:hypothetical protein